MPVNPWSQKVKGFDEDVSGLFSEGEWRDPYPNVGNMGSYAEPTPAEAEAIKKATAKKKGSSNTSSPPLPGPSPAPSNSGAGPGTAPPSPIPSPPPTPSTDTFDLAPEKLPSTITPPEAPSWGHKGPSRIPDDSPVIEAEVVRPWWKFGSLGPQAKESAAIGGLAGAGSVLGTVAGVAVGALTANPLLGTIAAQAGSMIGELGEQAASAVGPGYSKADISSYMPGPAQGSPSPMPGMDPMKMVQMFAAMAAGITKMSSKGVTTETKKPGKM